MYGSCTEIRKQSASFSLATVSLPTRSTYGKSQFSRRRHALINTASHVPRVRDAAPDPMGSLRSLFKMFTGARVPHAIKHFHDTKLNPLPWARFARCSRCLETLEPLTHLNPFTQLLPLTRARFARCSRCLRCALSAKSCEVGSLRSLLQVFRGARALSLVD